MARKDEEKKRDEDEDEDDAEERTSKSSDSDDEDDAVARDAEGDGDPDEERDASTKGVAKALGVDPDDEEEEAAGEAAASSDDEDGKEPVKNRAARRREEATRRKNRNRPRAEAAAPARKAKSDGDEGEEADEDVAEATDAAPLPKDKNARAKELLRRRREAVEKKGAIGLSASEVVQDQLARAASKTGTWFQKNFKTIVAVVGLGLAGTVGAIYFLQHQAQKAGKASDDLNKAILAEWGYVFNDERKDPRAEEAKKSDPVPVFASNNEKNDAILAAYSTVVSQHGDRPAALLAKLGVAGTQLEKGDFDAAISGFDDVLKSELAKADIDIRGRATEGRGFALEGKKDLEGALAAFTELEKIDKSFEDLARYHQARMFLKKDDKAKAKELLAALQKKLELKSKEAPALRASVEEYLTKIDPSAVPKRKSFGGTGGMPSQEEIEQMMREQMKKKLKGPQPGDEHDDEDGDEGPMPPMPAPGPGNDGSH